MYPQNKISGTAIAWGRGTWGSLEDSDKGYTFDAKDSFNYGVTQQWLTDHDIEDADLFDCVIQIEDMLGDPDTFKPALGMFKASGLLRPGIVVRSRSNPLLTCVFTPVANEFDDHDGYFEWFWEKETADTATVDQWISSFERLTGAIIPQIQPSAVVPTYAEACSRASSIVSESQREQFLKDVWHYHKTTSPGYKKQMESKLVGIWESVLAEADPSLQPPKRWWGKMEKKLKKRGYTGDRISNIIGSIWYHRLSPEKRAEIRGREGKTYAPAAA